MENYNQPLKPEERYKGERFTVIHSIKCQFSKKKKLMLLKLRDWRKNTTKISRNYHIRGNTHSYNPFINGSSFGYKFRLLDKRGKPTKYYIWIALKRAPLEGKIIIDRKRKYRYEKY